MLSVMVYIFHSLQIISGLECIPLV
uniref:Uncharacterized protein n=1 Tax=Anguilla anguilla TaxID=7936 RepID=A0A0E9VAM4_ANGAN